MHSVKPAPFDYVAPLHVVDALELLAADAGSVVLAGGQSLLPLLNLRLSRPSLVVDIKRLDGMSTVQFVGGAVRIGPCVTQAQALRSPDIIEHVPLLAEALRHVGNRETRARGTVAGSVAHSDPVAEIPAAMVALGASYQLTSVDGARVVDAEDFHLGTYTTQRTGRELITAVEVPILGRTTRWDFTEVRDGVFALCGLAAVCGPGRLDGLKLVSFGVGGSPQRLTAVEEVASYDVRNVRDAVLTTLTGASNLARHDDVRAHVLATLVERQVARFLERRDA